jgi:nicotinamidase-related amidase
MPKRSPNRIIGDVGIAAMSGGSLCMMDRFNGLDVPESVADALDPATLAFVVYDMQTGILAQVADRDRVLGNVLKLLAATRERGVRTVFTRHYFMPVELAGVYQLRQAKIWQGKDRAADTRPLIPHDSPGFELVDQLEPQPSEAILDKITMSAFEGTPLNLVLRDCGINAVAIVGVAMEVGIEPTARHAADLGYIPVIVRDACGAGHQEAAARSIAGLEYSGDAVLTDANTICRVFSRSDSTQP